MASSRDTGNRQPAAISWIAIWSTSRTINAIYRVLGADYSFDALVHVMANGRVIGSTAMVTGVVTDGWLAGKVVSGDRITIADAS